MFNYFGFQFGDTPEDKAPKFGYSMKLEAMVNYKLNETMTGYMGYAFNYDGFRFHATDPLTEGDNKIDIYGHYLNFKFKLDF